MVEHARVSVGYNPPGREMAEAEASFEAFFEAERDRLFGLLALMTGNRHEAEEIAQDAFLALWERWHRVRLADDPAGYLHRTAVNFFRRRYRRTAVWRRVSSLMPTRAEGTSSSESALLLSEALAVLTPRQRAALVLTEMLGYSGEEAAKLLGIKASTVAALKHQGRTTLRSMEPADD